MSNECVPPYHCGTHAPGWLLGAHPEVSDGVVTRTVCFSWRNKCCRWRSQISVRNCGDFYVYKLQRAPKCKLRYCGVGKQGTTTTPGPTTNPIPTTIGKWWCYTVLFNINVYKKQLYLSVTKPNKNTLWWRFFVFVCSYEVSGSADEGKRKLPSNRQELGVNSSFTVFLARISVSAHDLLGKARLLFVFQEGRAYFVGQSQSKRMWWRFARDLYWKLLRCCKMTKLHFFSKYCVLVPLSSRINKGKKKESAYFQCAQKFLNN